MKKIVAILSFLILLSGLTPGQDYNLKHNLSNKRESQFTNNVLKKIEHGISNGNTSAIAKFLSAQTYLSLLNGVSGYYSSNQAYYVLEEFFKEYQVISFRFDNYKIDKISPYATGTFYYSSKGKRSEAKVYITLTESGKTWKITQISII